MKPYRAYEIYKTEASSSNLEDSVATDCLKYKPT